MSLSVDDVRKLALLARLELSEDEVSTIGAQLDNILDFVHQLSELDTSEIEPMTTALDVDNRWRADVAVQGLTTVEALGNSPAHDDQCFLVPPVLGSVAAKK